MFSACSSFSTNSCCSGDANEIATCSIDKTNTPYSIIACTYLSATDTSFWNTIGGAGGPSLTNVIAKNSIVYFSLGQSSIGACVLQFGNLVNCVNLCATVICPGIIGGMAFSDDMNTMFIADQTNQNGVILACGVGANGMSLSSCSGIPIANGLTMSYVSIVGEDMFVVANGINSVAYAFTCTFTANGAASTISCPLPSGVLVSYTEPSGIGPPYAYKLAFGAH